MKARLIIAISFVIAINIAMAQVVVNDSIAVSTDINDNSVYENVTASLTGVKDSISAKPYMDYRYYRPNNAFPSHSIGFSSVFSGGLFDQTSHTVVDFHPAPVYPGLIYADNNLAISGNVDVTTYPGMMNKATGTLGASVSTGRFNFYIGGVVNKYSFYNGLIRQIGLHSNFTYEISSPFSITAFAYYYGKNAMPIMPDGSYIPPSMLGFYDVSRFGGFVNYKASEHFGLMMGGQVVERQGPRNYYEVEPIATPYINVGRGKKKIGIGLPVGQILYGIFGR